MIMRPNCPSKLPPAGAWGVGGFCAILAVSALWPAHGRSLNWDEVDYVNAARLGLWTHITDQSSLSPGPYIQLVRAKLAGQPPEFPTGYDESCDPFHLRHLHPPLVIYLLVPLSDSSDERLLRSIQLVGSLLLVGVSILAHRVLSVVPTLAGTVAVGALSSWASILLFGTISFHGWLAICIAATAAITSSYSQIGGRNRGLALSAALAASALTLESGLFVWLLVATCLFVWRGRILGGLRRWWLLCILGGVIAAGICALIWPGAVLKVTPIKIVLHYAYRIFFVNREYAGIENRWYGHIRLLWPVAAIIFASIFFALSSLRQTAHCWGPYLVIGVGYGVMIAPFAISVTYILPAMIPLMSIVGLAADAASARWARAGFALVSVTVLIITAGTEVTSRVGDHERLDLLSLQEMIRGKRAYADGGHIYRFYLDGNYNIHPISVTYDGELTVRQNGSHRMLTHKDIHGSVVVIRKRADNVGHDRVPVLLEGWRAIELRTVTVYVEPPCVEAAVSIRIRSPSR